MKKIIPILLIFCLLGPSFSLFAQQAEDEKMSQNDSYNLGVRDAKHDHGTGGWIAGGLVSGTLLGLIGTGICMGIAATSNPSPDYIPEKVEMYSYENGYEKKGRQKNIRAAGISGGIMSLLWGIAVYSAYN